MTVLRTVVLSLLIVAVATSCLRQTPPPEDVELEEHPPGTLTVQAGPDQIVSLSDGASLDGRVSDTGRVVTIDWSRVGGPGDVTFADTAALDTTVTFTEEGVYTLRLEASDGQKSVSDDVVVTVRSDYLFGLSSVALDVRVGSSSDDAEERETGGMRLTSSDLELTRDDGNQSIGLRFGNVTVPAGAVVTSAYIQFTADESSSEATSLTLFGQASTDPATFSGTKFDVSGRPRTGASVGWTPDPWVRGDAGPAQRTPELRDLIQEIVDQSGWSSGNSVAVIITGSGLRTAEAFDGQSQQAPLLHVEYEGDGTEPVNQAPTVDAGPDHSVTLAAGAVMAGAAGDDGLPAGTLSTTWSQVDGPGTATFADAAAQDTAVSFSAAGAYTLRLEASDGELSSSDVLVVTVSDEPVANQPPVVDAGPDQSVTLAAGAVMAGSASDDGLPSGTLTTTWSQVDGPGTATFADPAALDSAVSFSAAGVYTLRLDASDGESSAFDQVVVTVREEAGGGEPNPVTGLTQVGFVKTGYEGGTLLDIPSIDPSGVSFYPGSSRLLIVDGEINEEEDVYAVVGADGFETDRLGTEVFGRWDLTSSLYGSNNEPTGIVYCPFDGHVYISNDRSRAVYRYGFDGSDLTLTDKLVIRDYTGDPEGVTCDPDTGLIYVIGGVNVNITILEYDGGLRVVGQLDLFDINSSNPEGVPSDAEGIAFDPVSQNLFVVSPADDTLFVYTLGGEFVTKFDLVGSSPRPINLAGIGIGPSSNDSGAESFYIVDRRRDNNSTNDPRDGALYEFRISRER
jgi:hypothetical protein